MCWVKKDDLSTNGHILSSAATTHQAFYITSSGLLSAGHSNVFNSVSAAWPAADEWHFAAVTYDPTETLMILYIDGVEVDRDATVAQRTLADLTAYGYNSGSGLIGRAQDLRYYNRALTGAEIKEIYKTTLV